MIEEKFCSGCSQYRNIENMEKQIRGNGVRRWICIYCLAKTSDSIYASKKNATVDRGNRGAKQRH